MDRESFRIVRGEIAPYYPNPPGTGNPDFTVCFSLAIMSPLTAKGKCPLYEGGGHGGENYHEQ